jgi:hypothetical protein
MDYARLRILGILQEHPHVITTTASDYTDISRWLPGIQLLVTYVAGPYPDDQQDRFLRDWLAEGGRWLALHGTSGGKAARVGTRGARKMVKGSYHRTLGSFFLNHPPVRKFRVDVVDRDHPLCRGLPQSFEVMDELYLIELQDPSPPGFAFAYDRDTSLLADGKTRVLGYEQPLGKGAITYVALGHCHSPETNIQPFVDASVEPSGTTPLLFRGAWETDPFEQLLRNGIEWGCS